MKTNKKITPKQILNSLKKAIHKMLVETAAYDGEIVISDEKGNPIKIKAKKALKDWNK
jgi:CxxC motif-containing protein